MLRLLWLVIGYGIGNMQSAYIVGRIMKVDLRQHGSGNLGTTNALRVLGKRAGVATFVLDILKSVIAFVVCYKVFDSPLAGVYASFGAVLGHDFPFYLNFKGGKGIAATIGLIICLSVLYSPYFALVTFGLGIAVVIISNMVSVGSLLFVIVIPIMCFVLNVPVEITWVTIAMGILALFKHKENLIRLKNGNENKLIKKKS